MRPIRITRLGSLGRAQFEAIGSDVTVLVTRPGSVARAALAARRGITLLDVTGGTSRAGAIDRLAVEAASAADCGVLLSIGGDIATAGQGPEHGWRVRIADGGRTADDVMRLRAGGLATVRSTRQGSVWRSVTVAAGSCRAARHAALTAAAIGESAHEWMTSLGLAARLAGVDGSVVHTGRWSALPVAA